MTRSLQSDVLPGRPVSEGFRGDEPEALGHGLPLPRAEPTPVHERGRGSPG
ncbi:hypothetical protein SPURM210S_01801 [Streptomyces purpurascens]